MSNVVKTRIAFCLNVLCQMGQISQFLQPYGWWGETSRTIVLQVKKPAFSLGVFSMYVAYVMTLTQKDFPVSLSVLMKWI